MSEVKSVKVKLDWTRLLGFDQADSTSANPETAKLQDQRFVKFGQKAGSKLGVKVGVKFGIKTGLKLAH